MRWNIVTLFPEFFASPLDCALMGSARQRGIVEVSLFNPRDMTTDRHKSVDDRPYGGGPGMVMAPGPLARTLKSIPDPGRMLLLTPSGRPFTEACARELVREEALTLICGRYEGIDARLESLFPLEPVSIGDFVLNGGECAALAVMESVSRLLPGYMGHEESGRDESFSSSLLEHPHYTRPEEYEGERVPPVLTGGDHARIERWRREESLRRTLAMRPELLEDALLDKKDMEWLAAQRREEEARGLFIGLVHYPVLSAQKKTLAVSLTNLDIHDICRSSRTYGLGGVYVITPLEDQQRLLKELLVFWTEGPGSAANPHRARALSLARGAGDVREAAEDIFLRTGRRPRLVATGASLAGTLNACGLRHLLKEEPVFLLFGTGHGLAPGLLKACDATLPAIRPCGAYNHLSVRAAAAIVLDRLFGDWR